MHSLESKRVLSFFAVEPAAFLSDPVRKRSAGAAYDSARSIPVGRTGMHSLNAKRVLSFLPSNQRPFGPHGVEIIQKKPYNKIDQV